MKKRILPLLLMIALVALVIWRPILLLLVCVLLLKFAPVVGAFILGRNSRR